jgi:hypothetical protein
MLKSKSSLPPDMRDAIDAALVRERMSFGDDRDALNGLINAYHGYKNAYEAVSTLAAEQITMGDDSKQNSEPASLPDYYPPVFNCDGLRTDPKVIHNQ